MLGGYWRKMAVVDLTTEKIEYLAPREEDLKKYIGASGLGAKLLYENLDDGVDPLGPEHPPVQPVKMESASGVDVRVTGVPGKNSAAQVPVLQEIPDGSQWTEPPPVPVNMVVRARAFVIAWTGA